VRGGKELQSGGEKKTAQRPRKKKKKKKTSGEGAPPPQKKRTSLRQDATRGEGKAQKEVPILNALENAIIDVETGASKKDLTQKCRKKEMESPFTGEK